MLSTKKYPTFSFHFYRGLDDTLRDILVSQFAIHADDIDDIFSPTQLSKYEIRKEYSYFALQLGEIVGQTLEPRQVHCFIGTGYIFLIDEGHFSKIDHFQDISDALVIDQGYTNFDLFYELLDLSIIEFFRFLTIIRDRMETLETHIFDGHVLRNDQIFEIQDLKKNIINFKSLTLPLDEMLDDLAVKFAHLVDEPSRFAFEDARDKVKKIMNRLENFREIMKLLTETNELIIARSTNATIRRLALFNCIIMCPSLIAGFFGMNIDIGWLGNDYIGGIHPVGVIFVGMVVFMLSVYLFFRMKKWI